MTSLQMSPRVPGRSPAFTQPPSPSLPLLCRRALIPFFHCHRQRLMGCVVKNFGIHQCLRQKLAWSPCISCQSCQQPSSSVFIRCSSLLLPTCLPAGSPAAAEPPPPRPPVPARLPPHPGPHPAGAHPPSPPPPPPPGPHPAALYQNKHNSRCFLTRLSPEKAASLYKGFSVGISLLKTINIIRNLLPLQVRRPEL